MILNINKLEVDMMLDSIAHLHHKDQPNYDHLRKKLKLLQAASEPLKSTIEQVRTAE